MLKTGIFHPQLARVLAELRHKDTIIIGDAGLPIPKGVERVDLGWRPGDPAYLDVLEEILKYIVAVSYTHLLCTFSRSPFRCFFNRFNSSCFCPVSRQSRQQSIVS